MSIATDWHAQASHDDGALSFDRLAALIGGKPRVDVPCPACSPWRRTGHRKLKVLRIWRVESAFLTFKCQHCGARGYRSDGYRTSPEDRARHAQARAHNARMRDAEAERKRQWVQTLWSWREPIEGTIGETYLREARGITCALPDSIAFLPATRNDPRPS